ncbi:hypothetical protein HYH02_007187 [Chlamydomonas schloesseri]|uniref:Uncharacterized protein n=1 Tax=Chlamydomonas schloesseri TaxID=2026947 RepID=A0A836B4Y1_9CHLO|nr:hypothetical protein HYH02_007185 [Chlamydomonas schloesseri]KAG2447727.1 hypothetical protein HYH02_007187 [Chlamydomonas schloesseri]|eukprot:KAG2447725.1 hypothetical protein HYH02_007185 [Chlamydomonas schloesseri]
MSAPVGRRWGPGWAPRRWSAAATAATAGGIAAGARGAGVAAAGAASRRRRHSDGALGQVSHAAASRAAALVHYLRTVFGTGTGHLLHHSPPAAPWLGAPGAGAPGSGGGSPAWTASGGNDAAARTGPPPALPADQQLTLLALNGCTGVGVDVAAQLAAVMPSLRRLSVGFSLPPQDGAVLGHLCELLASTTVGRGGGAAAAAGREAALLVVGVCPRPSGRRGRRGGASQAERLELLAEMNRRLEDMGAGDRVRLAWALKDEAAEQSSQGHVEVAEGCAQRQRSGEGWGGDGNGGNGSGSDDDEFGASADEEEDEYGGQRGDAGPPVSRWWAW